MGRQGGVQDVARAGDVELGKRSSFERMPRDFYPTPYEAVAPLLEHLPARMTFVEPCAGDGALVRHLSSPDRRCVWAFDIHPADPFVKKFDAMDMRLLDSGPPDFIITNPPWDRKVLHPMIEHFKAQRPTWLLFDAGWMHTRQSARFMPWCRKIVSVGRVKWFPESKMTGKDDCAWYLFDHLPTGPTEFIGRQEKR